MGTCSRFSRHWLQEGPPQRWKIKEGVLALVARRTTQIRPLRARLLPRLLPKTFPKDPLARRCHDTPHAPTQH